MQELDVVIESKTIHDEELMFSIVAKVFSYRVEFTLYEICDFDEAKPTWQKCRSDKSPDPVSDMQSAQIYLHGYVKWDGCSNWHFDQQEIGMLHFCGREDLTRVGSLLTRCFDLAREMCPRWFEG
jgi:hypothetical protein